MPAISSRNQASFASPTIEFNLDQHIPSATKHNLFFHSYLREFAAEAKTCSFTNQTQEKGGYDGY
jgi:hypothetical protein